jgi:hypothetical protein
MYINNYYNFLILYWKKKEKKNHIILKSTRSKKIQTAFTSISKAQLAYMLVFWSLDVFLLAGGTILEDTTSVFYQLCSKSMPENF